LNSSPGGVGIIVFLEASETANRTRVIRVTGGYTSHYTISNASKNSIDHWFFNGRGLSNENPLSHRTNFIPRYLISAASRLHLGGKPSTSLGGKPSPSLGGN